MVSFQPSIDLVSVVHLTMEDIQVHHLEEFQVAHYSQHCCRVCLTHGSCVYLQRSCE